MLVQFLKTYARPGESRQRRAGELLELPDQEAQTLIEEGIAKEHNVGPTETKEEEV